MSKIVDLTERLPRKKINEFDDPEFAEMTRRATSDIAWLAELATDGPLSYEIKRNFSKRQIVAEIRRRIKSLESISEVLQQRAEEDEQLLARASDVEQDIEGRIKAVGQGQP
jgi:hypothetical protein